MVMLILQFVVIACGAIPTSDHPECSNIKLIAAMPSGVESVFIRRYDKLLSKESVFAGECKLEIQSLKNDGDQRSKALAMIQRAIAMAGPVVHAEGGSGFTWNTGSRIGIGDGNYESRSIWITQRSLSSLNNQLKSTVGSEKVAINNATHLLYHFVIDQYAMNPSPKKVCKENRYIIIPSENTIIITESRDDALYIARSLASQVIQVSKEWQDISQDVNLESPIVLLKQYNQKNGQDYYSPYNAKYDYTSARINSVALVLPSVKSVTYDIRCIASDPTPALYYYHEAHLSLEEFQWNVSLGDKGFTATVKRIKDTDGTQILMLRILYGINVFI